MTGMLLSLAGAYGVFLIYTAAVFGWRGVGPGPSTGTTTRRRGVRGREWLNQAGLIDVAWVEFIGVLVVVFVTGAAIAFAIFGGAGPAVVAGLFSASLPVAAYRQRRRTRRAKAQESWPRMIEEIRILTSSVGRSIPQALFEVGLDGPQEMRGAFRAAHREWQISTDFGRTISVLKTKLADPTADAVCETLLIANELGGGDVDRRLADLADDRRADVHHRKDARAKQAGVRFARRFVLIVPMGMATAGLSVGNGRRAYQTPSGQLLVIVALVLVVVCWVWAGKLMQIPEEERVFRS